MTLNEKIQLVFVGNLLLPAFLGTQIAAHLYETRPYGMVIGTIVLYFYVRYLSKDEANSKALYIGSVVMFFAQAFPLIQVIVGAVGMWLVGYLDTMKLHNEKLVGIRWDVVGNTQLFLLTVFCGFVIMCLSIWIGGFFAQRRRD